MAASDPRKRTTAFDLFWEQLGRANVAVGGVGSLLAAILLWKFVPDKPVPLWLVALVGVPTLVALVSLVVALRKAAQLITEKPTTSIVSVVPAYAPFANSKCILIVDWSPSAALPVGSAVTVSVAQQRHERPLGIGTVRTIQSDGGAQVTIDQLFEGAEEALRQLLEPNGAELVKQLRLGSQVLFQHIPGMAGQATPTVPGAAGQPAQLPPVTTPKSGT